MLEQITIGLLAILIDGSNSQISVSDGKIYAGDDSLKSSTIKKIMENGWYYDDSINSWFFELVGNDSYQDYVEEYSDDNPIDR
jgi:hypothetical protein